MRAYVMKHIIGLCYRDGTKDIVLEETLRTEGIPYVRVHRPEDMKGLRGVIVGEGFDSWSSEIGEFLESGGVLLSFRPSGSLADELGLEEAGVQENGYLIAEGRGAEIISYEGRLQIFGETKLYWGGERLAGLSPKEDFGGIIRVKRGSGEAIVVAFDLPTTALTMLQPASECGKLVDGFKVEYDLGRIPQVDLLRRLIIGLFLDALKIPVLRLWYFPSCRRALLIISGDQDGCDLEVMKVVLEIIKELKLPYTLFVMPTVQPISRDGFRMLAEEGIEFGFHPDFFFKPGKVKISKPGARIRTADPSIFNEDEFRSQLRKAEEDVGCKIIGERTHGLRWETIHEIPLWAERAGIQHESSMGSKMWESKPPMMGYWAGSGLPYHFIDPDDGYRRMNLIEIPLLGSDNMFFWKPTEYIVAIKPDACKSFIAGMGLSEDEAFEIAKKYLDEALEKYHTANFYCFHPIYLAARRLKKPVYYTDTLLRKLVNYARERGAGIISINSWNNFWRARENAEVESIEWNMKEPSLRCRVKSPTGVESLTFIAPLEFDGKRAEVQVDGRKKKFEEARILGGDYAMFTIDIKAAGEITIEVKYTQPPGQ